MPCLADPGSHGSDLLPGSGSSRCCCADALATGIVVAVAAAPGGYTSLVGSWADPVGDSSIGLPEIGNHILVSGSDSVHCSVPDPVRSHVRANSVVGSRPLPSSGSSLDEPTY